MTHARRAPALLCWLTGCLLAACSHTQAPDKTGLDANARVNVAEAAEASGDHDLAVSMYETAATNAPNDSAMQVLCANGLARNGKPMAARDLLLAQLRLHPRDDTLLRGLAAIYVVSGQPGPAISKLNEALAARPDDISALLDKAVALDLQGHHADAQRLYRQMLARTPDDAVISNDLAVSLMIEGRTREAQAVLAPFAESENVPERLRINLGLIYAANGDTDSAKRLLGDRAGEGDVQILANTMAAVRPNASGVQVP